MPPIETLATVYVPATGTLYASSYFPAASRATRRGPKDAPTSGSEEKARRTVLLTLGTIVARISVEKSAVTRFLCAS